MAKVTFDHVSKRYAGGVEAIKDMSLEIKDKESVKQQELQPHRIKRDERILFKTRNSNFWNNPEEGFRTDYTHVDATAARQLVNSGVKLVGIDYLSIERFDTLQHETHHILLSNNVVVLEGLDLRKVAAGLYELICLPLKIAGGSGDGAPARTILRTLS